jgi:phosphatidylglycerophosphatase A
MSSEPGTARSSKPAAPVVFIGSACYAGFSPVASGTVGSAVALAVFWLVPPLQHWAVLLASILVSFAIGIPIATVMERHYGHDPSEVVWDEVVGMWISLFMLPAVWYWWLTAFLLFRAFDIVKPPPARFFDRMKGGFGIMMDDVIAGLYANLLVQIIIVILSRR